VSYAVSFSSFSYVSSLILLRSQVKTSFFITAFVNIKLPEGVFVTTFELDLLLCFSVTSDVWFTIQKSAEFLIAMLLLI